VIAFVAGATGYVGQALVRRLARGGHRAVAHVRPDSPRLADWRRRLDAVVGAEVDATPWEEAAMTATLARLRPDAVFALLGTTRRRGAAAARGGGDPARESYEAVDYGLTALLVRAAGRAAADTGHRPRVVYLSSVGVGPSARGAYLQVRWRMEQELRAAGLPWVVARPSFITGPDREEDRPAERIGAAVTDALLAPVGWLGGRRLADRYRSTTADALAAALERLARDPAAAGRVVEGDGLR
jgi:nucleoside-diphosphate-sugar epimerase